MSDGFWIILIGALVAGSCSMVGCFLVLRRQAMMGDAISHGILPGIVLAFLFTGSRNIVPMLIGAGALGLLTAFITDTLTQRGRLQSDAAMGVTFTWLFALGVILVTRYAGSVDLDVDCVLHGELIFSTFRRLMWNGTDMGPQAVWTVGFVAVLNLCFVLIGYKQIKVTSFDPGLAASLGINVTLWHYLLMSFTSVTTVACFESVGAVLVVAMLIVPANTAYLLTERLSLMLGLSVLAGTVSSALGYGLAYLLDGSVAGAITTVGGLLFVAAALFSPKHGVVVRALRRGKSLEFGVQEEGLGSGV